MNPNLAELETLIDPDLPNEFILKVPDAWLRGTLIAGLVYIDGTKERVPETSTRVRVSVNGHAVTFRADSDPEDPSVSH